MVEISISSFSELDNAIDGASRSALCRGVSDSSFELVPSLFRHPSLGEPIKRETNLMWLFKAQAKAHLSHIPTSELDWLVIAQHHGLPTRLLDWSLSPLVAAFFAIKENKNKHGAIFIYDIGNFEREENINLDNLNEIIAFFPSHATRRVTAQSGMFTVHPLDNPKLENDKIKKIIISKGAKSGLMEKLVKFGIHHGTLFPELDGLSKYIKYLQGYK